MHVSNKGIGKAMKEFQDFVDEIFKAINGLLLEINVDKTGYTIHNYG